MVTFTRPRRVLGNGRQEVRAADHNELARCIEQLQDAINSTSGQKGSLTAGPQRTHIPWRASFRKVDDENQVQFNLGLLDQQAAANWNEWFAIEADATKWPTLIVNASDGKVTSFTIALEDATPTESQVQENTPPSEFRIVLGCISNLTALMTTSENLETHAIEVYRTSKGSPAEGEEAFNRHWKWAVYQQTSGDYPYIV